MHKFAIKVQGKNYLIEVEKCGWFFRKQISWKKVGFYTTRYVEGENANEAIEKIFSLIDAELNEIARPTDLSRIELCSIQEDESAYDMYAPGNGFTFYSEES